MESQQNTIALDYSTTRTNIEILSIRWSLDDSHIAAGCSDGTVKLFSGAYGTLVRSMSCKLSTETFPVTSIRWRPERSIGKTRNVLLAVTCDGEIFHWHASSGKTLHSLKIESSQGLSSDYNTEGTNFAIGCNDKSIKIFDESSRQMIEDLNGNENKLLGHDNRITSIKWIDNNLILSGGWDHNLMVWDLRNGQVAKCFYGPRICGDSLDIKGDMILVGSYNIEEQLQIWSLGEGKCVFSENMASNEGTCMAYTAQYCKFDNGNTFALGGVGGSNFYVYDTESRKNLSAISDVNKGVFSLDSAHSSHKVVLGCGDGSLRVYKFIDNFAENLDLED